MSKPMSLKEERKLVAEEMAILKAAFSNIVSNKLFFTRREWLGLEGLNLKVYLESLVKKKIMYKIMFYDNEAFVLDNEALILCIEEISFFELYVNAVEGYELNDFVFNHKFFMDDYDNKIKKLKKFASDIRKRDAYKELNPQVLWAIDVIESNENKGSTEERLYKYSKKGIPYRNNNKIRQKKPIYAGMDKHSVVYNSPKEIKKFLDEKVYSQEEAKKAAALVLWSHLRGIRRTMLFAGPSGCGKTEIFRTLKGVYGNIFIFDASNITEDGWKGSKKINSVFKQMLSNGFSKSDIEKSIIVFDEFDKLCAPKHNASGENVQEGIQGELLSFIEGTDVFIDDETSIDTRNITFVFLGAFESLFKEKSKVTKNIGFIEEKDCKDNNTPLCVDDFIKYGIRAELLGRISSFVALQELNVRDFYNILKNTSISPIAKLENEYKLKIKVSNQMMIKLAKEAYGGQGLGVRYLKSRVMNLLDDKLYNMEFTEDIEDNVLVLG